MSGKYQQQVEGFLEKRGEKGVGTIGKGWKRRFFCIEQDKLFYYEQDENIKELRGSVDLADVTAIGPKEKDPNTLLRSSQGDGWEFFIDTPVRRYELRTMEAEYVMWYWIEALKRTQARISARKRSEEMIERQQKRRTIKQNSDDYIISEMQIKNQQMQEAFKKADGEWKIYLNGLKRKLKTARSELAAKDSEMNGWKERCTSLSLENQRLKDQVSKYQSQLSPSQNSENDDNGKEEITIISSVDLLPSNSSHDNRNDVASGSVNKNKSDMSSVNDTHRSPTPIIDMSKLSIDDRIEHDIESNRLLNDAVEEITILKEKLKKQEEVYKQQTVAIEKYIEELDATKRNASIEKDKLRNQVTELRAQVDVEQSAKSLLQISYDELQQEYQRSVVRMRSNTFGNWVPDSNVAECKLCKSSFSFFRRKHHCRQCGDIYCAKCSCHTATIPNGLFPSIRIRICSSCFSRASTIESLSEAGEKAN